jgi:cysteinyl-tRNA synthetase
MTIRFFILQAHYRSTLDFSNGALQAAEKGLKRLMAGWKLLKSIQSAVGNGQPATGIRHPVSGIQELVTACYDAMNDDFNSPVVIANLFEAVRIIHTVNEGKASLSGEEIRQLDDLFRIFITDILALDDESAGDQPGMVDDLVELIIGLRRDARDRQDWAGSDRIRDGLAKLGIVVKDTKEGTKWEREI